jgi:hypothetical protein
MSAPGIFQSHYCAMQYFGTGSQKPIRRTISLAIADGVAQEGGSSANRRRAGAERKAMCRH